MFTGLLWGNPQEGPQGEKVRDGEGVGEDQNNSFGAWCSIGAL